MDETMANEQVNIPSLVVILILSGLIVRYLFFSSPAGSSASGSASRGSSSSQRNGALEATRAQQREAAAEMILQMFPQVERRAVLWDLQRTGGSVAATTERILAGRLETPPVTFQPPPPPGGNTQQEQQQQKQPDKPAQPDLITRYKLHDKLAASAGDKESSDTESVGSGSGTGKTKAWSSNREERQALLQRRRDQMILEARRKMEAKLAAERDAAAGGSKSG
ncbi:hypothetical protein QBC47DRAFT_371986 [Echria macrotheca]|uniref:Coupling of ubiquitin conjugation to ER degradation protein 1 n=1 Tax=Echria macrotheca TaxID=438768 RepID=A0AAJ0F9U8_9PEZI|nr:hypothetical protein QBC47DRAFT_371986 [Echria macrotheca]